MSAFVPVLSSLSSPSSADLLEDETNLLLLRSLVSGESVSVNVNSLANRLKKHRNTIKNEVEQLFECKIVNPPICPFMLYKEYPILVVVRADLPDIEQIHDWVTHDKHIFAAYWSRQAEYNMLLFQYHKDVLAYQLWRESLTKEGKIPPRETRVPSNSTYVSNQMMSKYEPSAAIGLMEGELSRKGKTEVNGMKLEKLQFSILKHLVTGGVFKTNESLLCKELGIHRKTVAKRIELLMKNGWILEPVCRFPDFLCPPNYVLVFSMFDILKSRDRVIAALRDDPHVSMALRVSTGGYNELLFTAHPDVSEHMEWEQAFSRRFPGCVGRVNVTYLSPRAKILIDQQKVSLGIIQQRLARARGKRLRGAVGAS